MDATQEQLAPQRAAPGQAAAARPARRREAVYWLAAWAILLLYTAFYGLLILRHTAVPYFDQTSYLDKIRTITENLHKSPYAWANPETYLSAEPTLRPPLMMLVPAALWGENAPPRAVGEFWLLVRAATLMLGCWVLARAVGTARIVPGLLLVVLGSWVYMTVDPLVYLMDPLFTSLGFLLFALALRDLQRLTVRSAAAFALAALALELTKPAGVAFMLPVCLVIGIENLLVVLRRRKAREPWIPQTVGRAAVFLALGAVFAYLLGPSSYGAGVRWQYGIAQTGYWSAPLSLADRFEVLSAVVPLWMLLVAAPWVIAAWRRGAPLRAAPDEAPHARWLLAAAVAMVAWWYVFNTLITVLFDRRILLAVLPVGVALIFMLLARRPRAVALLTALGGALFALNLAAVGGVVKHHPLASYEGIAGPAPGRGPVAEVGLVPLMCDVKTAMLEVCPTGGGVVTVFNDDYVEPVAAALVMRRIGGVEAHLGVIPPPWGSDNFDLEKLLEPEWFLTKSPRSTISLQPHAFGTLRGLEALIVDPDSPLHGCFARRFDRTLRDPAGQPEDRGARGQANRRGRADEQTVTLWHRTRTPELPELAAALAYLERRPPNPQALAAIRRQRAAYQAILDAGTAVDRIDQATAERLAAAGLPEFRGVHFGHDLLLVSIRPTPRPDGGLDLELVWQAATDTVLDRQLAVHFLDASGKIVGQADYGQDKLRGKLKAGTLWRDRRSISPAVLQGATRLGLGVIAGPAAMLPVNHPSTDWDGHRLLIPLPSR